MKKRLFALMSGDTVEYTIGIFRDHVFREYPDGRIEKANDQDVKAARYLGYAK